LWNYDRFPEATTPITIEWCAITLPALRCKISYSVQRHKKLFGNCITHARVAGVAALSGAAVCFALVRYFFSEYILG
jgi:hypothetical protein